MVSTAFDKSNDIIEIFNLLSKLLVMSYIKELTASIVEIVLRKQIIYYILYCYQ